MAKNRELTDREREILELVATGASNRQIAQRLGISANTVKVHVRNIFEKTGAASRTEATLYAIQAGLVEGVESGVVTAERSWWQRGWVIAGGALALMMVALLVGVLVNPERPPPENIVDLEQLERERWQELSPMPTARKGLAVAAYDGKIYAIAGETEQGVTDVVERYDPVTDTWETLLPKPTAVTDVQAAVVGGKIYVPGGRLDSGDATDILEVFDSRSGVWEQASPIPQACSGYGLAAYEGRLYLFGGSDGRKPQASVWIFNADAGDWTTGEPMIAAGEGAGAVVVSAGILVAGGRDGEENRSKVQLYKPERDGARAGVWSSRADMPFAGSDLRAVGFGDIVYLFGGMDGDENSLMLEYTFAEEEWQVLALPFKASWLAPGVTQIGNKVFVLGGDIEGEATSQLVSYTAIYTVLLPIIK